MAANSYTRNCLPGSSLSCVAVATSMYSTCVGTWMMGTSTGAMVEPFMVGMKPS